MSSIIRNIQHIRKEKKISQTEISDYLDVDSSLYGKIERGEIELSVKRLEKIAELFNMPIEEIISYGKPKAGNSFWPGMEDCIKERDDLKNKYIQLLEDFNKMLKERNHVSLNKPVTES